jgi:DNA-directed RNA polymerase subunit beta'
VRDRQHVEAGQVLVEWDPFTSAILTEAGGKVVFKDIVEGENVREETDRVTGLTQMVIVESATAEKLVLLAE